MNRPSYMFFATSLNARENSVFKLNSGVMIKFHVVMHFVKGNDSFVEDYYYILN